MHLRADLKWQMSLQDEKAGRGSSGDKSSMGKQDPGGGLEGIMRGLTKGRQRIQDEYAESERKMGCPAEKGSWMSKAGIQFPGN